MKLSRRPVLLLLTLQILISGSAIASTASPQLNPPSIIVLQNQSFQFPLLSLISSTNITFSTTNTNPSITLVNSLQSFSTNTLTGGPQTPTAFYVDDTHIAYLDDSLNLYYGTYQQGTAPATLTKVKIGTNSTSCSSITTSDEYLAISCSYLQDSTANQTQLVILFDPFAQEFSNISRTIPFQSLSSPLPALMTTTESPTGPLIAAYFDNNTLQGRDPVVVIYEIESAQTFLITIPSSEGIHIQSIQAVYDGLFILDVVGAVYFADLNINFEIQDLEKIADTGEPIIGSCAYNQDYANPKVVAFTSDFAYFIQNSGLVYTYSAPANTSFVLCSLDSEFLYTVAKDNNNGSLYSITYAIGTANNGNPLVQVGTAATSILSISPGQTPGEAALLSETTLSTLKMTNPKIQVSNAQESVQFNITVDGTNTSIPINLTVISDPTQVYQKDSTPPPIYSFNMPTVDLQSLLIGPALGLASQNQIAFSGVYGSCSVSNFDTLSLPSYGEQNYVKIFPNQPYSSGSNILGVLASIQNQTLHYINVYISELYSAGTYNTPQNCTSTFQSASTTNIVTFATKPARCIFGTNFDICLVSKFINHITVTQGVIFTSTTQQCDDIYLWEGSSYNDEVSVCISAAALYIFNQAGQLLTTIPNTVILGQNFLTAITTNLNYPNLLIVSSSQAIIGLQVSLPLVTPNENLTPQVIFILATTVTDFTYIQLTANRLVLIEYSTNVISEYDLLEIYSPYLIGNYELFSLQLNPQFPPIYQPIPNHLSIYATNNSIPYLITLRPGNIATSTLLYSTSLATSLGDAIFASISTWYDVTNQYTIFFISNSTDMTYFYAMNSSYIAFANTSLGANGCLYCSGNKSLQIGSSMVPSTFFNFSITYTAIASEQPVSALPTPPQFTVRSQEPISAMPSQLFQGTVLDYSLTNVEVDSSNVLYMTTTLNITQTLQLNITGSSYSAQQQAQISLFSSPDTLYLLQTNELSTINLGSTPYQIQNVTLGSLPAGTMLTTGASNQQGNLTLAYTTGATWGIYNYPVDIINILPYPILQVKFINNLVFVLTTEQNNLIYVFNFTSPSSQIALVVQSTVFAFTPISFEVANLQGNTYVALVLDGSDNLYNFIIDTAGKTSTQAILPDFTGMVQSDLPLSPLQIMSAQFIGQPSGQTQALNFMLSITNFHSYSVQITYTTTAIESSSIIACFVQMPHHVSIGQSYFTGSFFLDIKQLIGNNYLFSYPINSTYPNGSGQPAQYPYIKPVERQVLTGANNAQIYATSGESGVAFTTSGQETNSVNIQIFSVSDSLEIGFNPSLSSSTLSTVTAEQATLVGANDYGSLNVQVGLDTPINILNSAYFIAFTCVFTIVFCVACIWFFRRAYLKRKNKMIKLSQTPNREIEENLIRVG